MTFFNTFNAILTLFLMMIMGYGAKKLKFIDNTLNKGLSNLVLKVTLPALIIRSMQFEYSRELMIDSIKMILISFLIYAITIGISYLIPKLLKVEGEKKDVFQFILIFSNVGYMGYPVVSAIYGDTGVFYTALYNLPFNFILLSLGVYVFCRNDDGGSAKINFMEILLNPGIIAVILGFAFFLLSIELPPPILVALESVGDATTPLSMIVIGSLLADMSIKDVMNEEKILWLSFARLIVIPMIVMGVLWVMGLRGLLLGVPVVISAMPAAANTAVFATLYNSDYYLASKGIFITTLLSLITIPLLTLFI
ncbi:MAG: AEC family transporter [Clostridiaceae bacterium]|nr:AEC family transporter [Clostridiaceae bacterium]